MTTIDRSALRSKLRTQVNSIGGGAYFSGGSMPDEALAEIFPDVKDALDAYEATKTEAEKLNANLKKVRTRRGEHKNHPEAVYTSDPHLGLVFSDPKGVNLQNEVRKLEKALDAVGAKAKKALLDYLVEAFIRLPESRDTFHQRAKDQDAEVQELAAKLTEAISKRERYWALAGQPYPGVSDTALPAVTARRVGEQDQLARDLKLVLDRILPFPKL